MSCFYIIINKKIHLQWSIFLLLLLCFILYIVIMSCCNWWCKNWWCDKPTEVSLLNFVTMVHNWNKEADFVILNKTLEKNMLLEEVQEFINAFDNNDDVEVMDWACDVIFVLLWTLYKYWFTPDEIYNCLLEVVSSNFTKLPFEKDENWKVKKWPNFVKPDIAKHLS